MVDGTQSLNDDAPGRGGGDGARDETPATIGPYKVLGRLGKGGMGEVFKARHDRTDKLAAIKRIKGEHATPSQVRQFELELRHLASVDADANIVKLIECGPGEGPVGHPWYAMEYVEGSWALDDEQALASLGLVERVRLLRDAARGLGHAHRLGVVHSDVKPSNIIVIPTDRGPVGKLTDFGLAHLRTPWAGGSGGMRGGTPAYLSPEPSGPEPTRAQDVYAMGMTMCQVLGGARQEVGWSVPEGLGRLLTRIIGRALAPSPEGRYPSARELSRDLDRWLASPVGAWRERWKAWAGRRPALGVAVCALVGALVALLCTGWVIGSGLATLTEIPLSLGAASSHAMEDVRVLLLKDEPPLRQALDAAGYGHLQPTTRAGKRVLCGLIAQKLAGARPRVVAWDLYFRAGAPEDEFLLHGMRALDRANCGQVIGWDKWALGPLPEQHPSDAIVAAKIAQVGACPVEETRSGVQAVGLAVLHEGLDVQPGFAMLAAAKYRHSRHGGIGRYVQVGLDLRDGVVRAAHRSGPDASDATMEIERIEGAQLATGHDSPATGLVPSDIAAHVALDRLDDEALKGVAWDAARFFEAGDVDLARWANGACVVVGSVQGGEDVRTLSDGWTGPGPFIQAAMIQRLIPKESMRFAGPAGSLAMLTLAVALGGGLAFLVSRDRSSIAARIVLGSGAALAGAVLFVLAAGVLVRYARYVSYPQVPGVACVMSGVLVAWWMPPRRRGGWS